MLEAEGENGVEEMTYGPWESKMVSIVIKNTS